MVSRKYTSDYRVESVIGQKGRPETVTVYCGKYFDFQKDRKFMDALRVRYTVLCAVLTVAAAVPLFFNNDFTRQMYLLLPLVLLFIPIYQMWASMYRLWTAKGPFIREHRDKIANRIPSASLFLLILGLAGLVGTVVYLCLSGFPRTSFLWAGLSLLRAALSVWMFALRGGVVMREVDPPADRRLEDSLL